MYLYLCSRNHHILSAFLGDLLSLSLSLFPSHSPSLANDEVANGFSMMMHASHGNEMWNEYEYGLIREGKNMVYMVVVGTGNLLIL